MAQQPQRLLTYEELRDHGVRYSRQWLFQLERAGKFPRRVAIGEYRVGWVEREIDDYIAARIASRSRTIGVVGSDSQIKKKRTGAIQDGR
jgi:prophage regulatory protein